MLQGYSEPLATLKALAEQHYPPGDATRKAPSYLRIYADLLGRRREEPLRVLELGVSSGASLLLWRDFLPNATIVGIDLAELPERVIGQARIHVLRGSQDDPAVLDQAAMLAGGPFDLIIDDASHIGYLTKRALLYLFPRWLVPGGCYVIEDFGTGFVLEYPDATPYTELAWDDAVDGTTVFHSSQHGMVGVIKQLIEPMMQQLMTGTMPLLPIQRLTIETNIACIEKALEPGPMPPALPPVNAGPGAAAPSFSAMLRAHEERIRAHEDRLEADKARIDKLELQMHTLRTVLGPAWRVLRRVLRR